MNKTLYDITLHIPTFHLYSLIIQSKHSMCADGKKYTIRKTFSSHSINSLNIHIYI